MRPATVDYRADERRRSRRTTRIVLVAFAILEALVIFGVVVPALLARPHESTAAHTHDRSSP